MGWGDVRWHCDFGVRWGDVWLGGRGRGEEVELWIWGWIRLLIQPQNQLSLIPGQMYSPAIRWTRRLAWLLVDPALLRSPTQEYLKQAQFRHLFRALVDIPVDLIKIAFWRSYLKPWRGTQMTHWQNMLPNRQMSGWIFLTNSWSSNLKTITSSLLSRMLESVGRVSG